MAIGPNVVDDCEGMTEEDYWRGMDEAMQDEEGDELFADYPKYTPGRIGWGTLLQIVEWEQRHGIGSTSAETVRAYREEGYGAAQAGVMLGLLDYGQATGCEDY